MCNIVLTTDEGIFCLEADVTIWRLMVQWMSDPLKRMEVNVIDGLPYASHVQRIERIGYAEDHIVYHSLHLAALPDPS